MRSKLALVLATLVAATAAAAAQNVLVVHDPTRTAAERKLTTAERRIFERDALPAVRKSIKPEVCEESLQDAGVIRGSFSEPGKRQSLIFYEYCQSGNGFGWNGLVLIEGDMVTGNFISEGGWGMSIEPVSDINQNGVQEFTLSYSGGLHQGVGGVGVDLMEFVGGIPIGLGWYKAEAFGPTEASTSWKLTAKPGKVPVYYKQKFYSAEGRKPRPVGGNSPTKLGKTFVSKFEVVK